MSEVLCIASIPGRYCHLVPVGSAGSECAGGWAFAFFVFTSLVDHCHQCDSSNPMAFGVLPRRAVQLAVGKHTGPSIPFIQPVFFGLVVVLYKRMPLLFSDLLESGVRAILLEHPPREYFRNLSKRYSARWPDAILLPVFASQLCRYDCSQTQAELVRLDPRGRQERSLLRVGTGTWSCMFLATLLCGRSTRSMLHIEPLGISFGKTAHSVSS